MFCSNCGQQIPDDSTTCPSCHESTDLANSSTGSGEMTPSKDSSDRTWAAACHLAGLIMFFTAIPGVLAALVPWLLKRNDSAFVDAHGKEAVNLQLSVLIAGIISIPFCFILIGFLMLAVIVIYTIVAAIKGAIAASDGKPVRFKYCIHFLT